MDERDDILSADAERARQAVASLLSVPARVEFRERLRQGFVSGAIAPVRLVEGAARAGRARPERTARLPWAWLKGPYGWAAAAAAGIVLVMGVQALNRGPAWQLSSVEGVGVAVVDGRPVPTGNLDELAAALTPGAHVRVPPGCRIDLASARTLAIQMTAETDATIPAPPGRWLGRSIETEIRSGEWRITTGPRFAGARLAISTPSARVEVTGTTLAVICEPEGTCVCVFEGRVRVGRDRSDLANVEQGRRRYVFVEATRDPENDVMRANEVTELEAFKRRMAVEVGRP